MRDVVIIGAGLSGLVAAYTLAQHPYDVTLIDVQRHPGGNIRSVEHDRFIMDCGAFALDPISDSRLLTDLELSDATFRLQNGAMAFHDGTEQLIKALSSRITAARMMRMAVSSLGELDNSQRLALCMENGLLLDARAVIVAVPARYAERLFYSYLPPVADALRDYHYDNIVRVSLGYRSPDLPDVLPHPPDIGYVYFHRTDHPSRVPAGHTLLQVGIRMNPDNCTLPDILASIRQDIGIDADPVTQRADFRPEADPLSCYDPDHAGRIRSIQDYLPDHIALIGSDYSTTRHMDRGIVNLNDRIRQGQQAARRMIAYLNQQQQESS